MCRSVWKGFFFDYNALKLVCKLKKSSIIKLIACNNFMILTNYSSKTFLLYNGKTYFSIRITENMIGYNINQFLMTKKTVVHKKRKK